jgi:hypothetical protein
MAVPTANNAKSAKLAGDSRENHLSGAQLGLAVACTVSPGGVFTGNPVTVMVSAVTVMCRTRVTPLNADAESPSLP